MSYKFDSLIMILNKLDGGEVVTVESLVNDLEMSRRTIYRYIETLRIAGFPINFNRKEERYTFDHGYRLRKPNLTIDEILAFALAKKLLCNLGTGMEQSLSSIEDKLSVKEAKLPRHIVLKPESPSYQVQSYLGQLHNAIMNFQKIRITYAALHSQQESTRSIDPHYLFFNNGFWYLRGYCQTSEAFRTFALDRIKSLEVLDEYFIPKQISPDDELSSSFGTWLDGENEEVVLIFDREVKSQVLRKKWHKNQIEQELQDGRLELRFNVKGLGGMKRWIYQWIPHVEVVAPIDLRKDFLVELKKSIRKNK